MNLKTDLSKKSNRQVRINQNKNTRMIKSLELSERLRTVLKDFSISRVTKVLKDSFSAPDVVTWLLIKISCYLFILPCCRL